MGQAASGDVYSMLCTAGDEQARVFGVQLWVRPLALVLQEEGEGVATGIVSETVA